MQKRDIIKEGEKKNKTKENLFRHRKKAQVKGHKIR